MSNRGAVWLGHISPQQQPNVQLLAVTTARTISERPSTIVVTRDLGDGTVVRMAPQVVRLEVIEAVRSPEYPDAMVSISKQSVVLMGYRDHPTIPSTDLIRGDLFLFQNRMWEIVEIIDTIPGRLMASAILTP